MLSCSSATVGVFTVIVRGTTGTLVHPTAANYTFVATSTTPCGTGCTATVTSPATITSFTANSTSVNFNASGQSGVTVTTTVTVPISSIPDPTAVVVLVNGTSIPRTITNNTTTYFITFSFTFHSTFVINIHLRAADFNIATSCTTVKMNAGDTATCTITVSPTNGFTQTVMLTANPSAGLTATLNPTSITGGSGTSTLTLSAVAAGNYTVTVTGSGGGKTHTTTPTTMVQVVDFQIFASPTVVNTTPNVAGTSTITVMPVNGFTGTVSLTTSISPTSGLTCSLSPTSITGGSGTSTLSCTGTGGSYTVVVTGTSGSLTHTANVTVNVQDFTITNTTINNVPLPVVQGQCNTATITITAVGGFAGTVQLSATSVPAGLNATLNPTSVTMSGTSQLKVCAPTAGQALYTVVVTGTSISPSLSHSTDVQVSVTPPPPSNICPTNTTPGNACLNPFFSQMLWRHRLSLSKMTGQQVWKFGISNPNNDTLYVQVQVAGADGSGVSGFTTISAVLVVAPTNAVNPPLNNQQLTFTFPSGDLGATFTWSATIMWGTSPTSLTGISTDSAAGVPMSGSFTVIA
jgi:hypothetical protein